MTTTAPTASYRLQLTAGFGFADAAGQLDVIAALGVSHVYLSPIAEAIPGSSHGYDVTDHTAVRADFGGAAGLDALLDTASDLGIGVIVDHVPNHVSVAQAELNAPWWTMLRDGPTSPAARWFDVDWEATGGQVIVPKLGAPLDAVLADGALSVGEGDRGVEMRYGPLRFPVAEGTADLPIEELLARQHYRLAHWRDPERNVRRFFTIDDLVAVRVEHPEVAAAVDTLPRRLVAHPAFAGVRVDHVDGLADPQTYLDGLRATIGDRLLFVEKIVAPGETLPAGWPVDGTTGYEHTVAVEHALLDPAALPALLDEWRQRTGIDSFEELALAARREVLDGGLRPDLDRLTRTVIDAFDDPSDADEDGVRSALIALTVALDRYRTYLPDDDASTAVLTASADRALAAADPEERRSIARVVRAVTEDAAARDRWQQLSGPAMAKGVEDRAFYRWFPLASLCEVGGTPEVGAVPVERFHEEQRRRQAVSPVAILAETTHDTKRSAGVRARSLALAAHASEWRAVVDDWLTTHVELVDRLDPAIVSLALQTAATARPLDAERLTDYLVKAAREGEVVTSWTDPDAAVERRLADLAGALVASGEAGPLAEFAERIEADGAVVGLRMLALHLTCPGFPDLYQGSPRQLLSLVDPDNRRPIDWDELRALVDAGGTIDVSTALAAGDTDLARSAFVRRVLGLRRREPGAFGHAAGYIDLDATGSGGEHVIAFARTDADGRARCVTVVTRARARPLTAAALSLPDGTWRSAIHDDRQPVDGGRRQLSDVVDELGVDVLARVDG